MKVYVAAPGQHNWPTIPDDVQDRLLALLAENFTEEKLQTSLKRSRKNPSAIRQHLAIGLRCVLRCLKQKQCVLVLVCHSLSPIILTKPILLLSQLNAIPAVRLKNLSTFLTKTFAIPRCATMAFKSSCHEHAQLGHLVDSLLQITNGCENETAAAVKYLPGKIIGPYQNPKRVPAGVTKRKKK